MPGIPDDKIAEVRSRADIVHVVGRVVNLKKAGRSWKGCCPFHAEKTPSFYVHPEKQIFHCFGCQAGGDVFRFLMDYEGRSFPEAVRALAEETGVEIPESSSTDDARARAQKAQRARLVEVNALAAEIFERWLWDDPAGAPGRAHLEERGIGAEVARRFGLGYAPLRNDLASRLVQRGVDGKALEAAGLLARGDRGTYERFRGRLMVPIRTPDGKTVAFGARRVEGDHPAKYLNSPESPVYRKSETLFGLDQARHAVRQADAAIVVEGYFDVIALVQAGVENAVATCGTALTEGHVRLLSRHAKDLYLVFDGDAAGASAAARAHEVLQAAPNLVGRVVRLPEADDPDTFVRSRGEAGFRELCDRAVPVTEFLLDRALDGVGSSVEDRVRAVEAVRPILRGVRDPLARKLYLARVAERLSMNERTLIAHLRGETDRSDDWRGPRVAGDRRPDAPSAPPPPAAEEALCLLALEHPGLLEELAPYLADLTHDGIRLLLESLLDAFRATGSVDVAGALSDLGDPDLARRFRAHLAGTAETEAGLEAAEAARWADQHLRRIRLAALDRREDAVRRRHAQSGVDPLAAARELNELKAERRRLSKASPRSA